VVDSKVARVVKAKPPVVRKAAPNSRRPRFRLQRRARARRVARANLSLARRRR
jgi:hypothetical protein